MTSIASKILEKASQTPEEAKAQQNSNELKIIANRFASIITSLEQIEEEKTNIKELSELLKDENKLDPKVTKQVAKLLMDPDKLDSVVDQQALLDEVVKLFGKVRK